MNAYLVSVNFMGRRRQAYRDADEAGRRAFAADIEQDGPRIATSDPLATITSAFQGAEPWWFPAEITIDKVSLDPSIG